MKAFALAALLLALPLPAFAADALQCTVTRISDWRDATLASGGAPSALVFSLDRGTGALQVYQDEVPMGARQMLTVSEVAPEGGKGQVLASDADGRLTLRIDLETNAFVQVNGNGTVLTGTCAGQGAAP